MVCSRAIREGVVFGQPVSNDIILLRENGVGLEFKQ